MNAYAEIKVTKAQISRVVSSLELCPGFDDDERLKLDMLEGETGLNELVSQLLSECEDDEGIVAAIKAQIDVRRDRIQRIESRIEARRNAIVSLLDSAQITKLLLPEATVSIRTLGFRPKVTDEEALPDDYCKFVRKPDMDAIKQGIDDGLNIPGVVMTNGGASLTVRRK